MPRGLGIGNDWEVALDEALEGLAPDPDLALVFASDRYGGYLQSIVNSVRERLRPRAIAGCTGQAIIGPGREVEDGAAISVLALSLPGATLHPVYVRQSDVAKLDAEGLQAVLGADEGDVHAWLLFADPFTLDVDALVGKLGEAYPDMPVIGGMASAKTNPRKTYVFSDEGVMDAGCVLVGVGGAWTVEAVVSQGAEPLGQPWTITETDQNLVKTIAGRPALEVLIETVQDLPEDLQERAGRNLLVGLAIDEYQEQFSRGDFLIRNLMGADQRTGAVAIGAAPRVGQTIQFHMRDSEAADEELRLMLETKQLTMGGVEPAGALVCSCNGRGVGLFGTPDHDARVLGERFEGLAAAGFFCNGEIGPVGNKTFVHGFTASIGLFVPVTPGAASE